MKSNELITKLKQYDKDYYAINDLQIITGETKNNLRIALNRLSKKGLLNRLSRNMYVLPDKIINYEKIAEQIDPKSYLSLESALSRYGILSQIPYLTTFVTPGKGKKLQLGNQTILFRKLQPKFYAGYIWQNGLRIATPEKALIDMIYFIDRGKAKLNLEELNLEPINKKALLATIKFYPPSMKKIINGLFYKKF